jgi:hypothetical protein
MQKLACTGRKSLSTRSLMVLRASRVCRSSAIGQSLTNLSMSLSGLTSDSNALLKGIASNHSPFSYFTNTCQTSNNSTPIFGARSYLLLTSRSAMLHNAFSCVLIHVLQNAYTEQCLGALRRISTLNNDLVQLPPTLSNLQARFRGKNSFSHIQRLHNMLYAYGATVIEIVRRKEFGGHFIGADMVVISAQQYLNSSFFLPACPEHS